MYCNSQEISYSSKPSMVIEEFMVSYIPERKRIRKCGILSCGCEFPERRIYHEAALLRQGTIEVGTAGQDGLVRLPRFLATDDSEIGKTALVQHSIFMSASVKALYEGCRVSAYLMSVWAADSKPVLWRGSGGETSRASPEGEFDRSLTNLVAAGDDILKIIVVSSTCVSVGCQLSRIPLGQTELWEKTRVDLQAGQARAPRYSNCHKCLVCSHTLCRKYQFAGNIGR